MQIDLKLFTVCFDNRPPNWFNSDEDVFFPWAPSYELSFVVRGYCRDEDLIFLTFRVYKGANDDGTSHGLELIYQSVLNEVTVSSGGAFYTQIGSGLHLRQPDVPGETDDYTAVVEDADGVVDTITFQVANLPADFAKVARLVGMKHRFTYGEAGDAHVDLSLRFRRTANYEFFAIVGAYLPRLAPDEELFDGPAQPVPPTSYLILDLLLDNECTVTASFDLSLTGNADGRQTYLELTLAGKTFFKMPLTAVLDDNDEAGLAPYHLATADDEASSPSHQLMPPAFAGMLTYLGKRRLFDHLRKSDPREWKRRHMVLTGKKGTGKRTAAHELGNILLGAGIVQGVEEVNAIDLLDPTNGYSPRIEEKLDNNCNNLLIVNNAEALTLKGAVGSLTGIEILANKLLKMDDITVVMLGKKGQMEELVKMCEPARELFYTFYDFEDVRPDVMTQISLQWLRQRHFEVAPEASERLHHYYERAYSLRGTNFANLYMARQTIDDEVLPRLVDRVIRAGQQPQTETTFSVAPQADPNLVLADDIPQAEERDPSIPLAKLESLIGLDNVKQSIINHTSLVRLNKIRADRGLYNRMPPMHMVFTGNPGTGKTTIAEYLGEIYRGIGALSSGHLVQTDRSKLVGQYIGDTEKNTLNAIQRAAGGVLFIDEAYNLFVKSDDNRDFGMRVIETLLTYLSLEDTDMIVILAGYTNEMKRMIESNPGLKSRFPYIFHFEDYSPDQLLRIGKLVLDKEQYRLSDEAERALSQYIIDEYNQKDEHFGNGRFVTRLLKSHIIPAMSQRLSRLPAEALTDEVLSTIETCDIPHHDAMQGKLGPVDETILKSALQQLDRLIGVEQAKQALHGYVTTVRLERQAGSLTASSRMLYWNFIGNTGTGKSTVAELLGKLMQGLGLLKRGHTVTLNIEELNSRDMYDTLEKALKRAADGLLFMDMDSPRYRNQSTDSIRTWLVNRIKETKQQTAVVFAEVGESNDDVLRQLALNGFASLYHSVVFSDFSAQELMSLLRQMLQADYRLTLSAQAGERLSAHVAALHRQATRNSPVNARTIEMLAQSVAQSARLRIAARPDTPAEVLADDLDQMEQQRSVKTSRIGF